MAYDFDGTNDRFIAASSSQVNLTLNVSISAWVNVDTLGPGVGVIVSKTSASNHQYELDITATGTVRSRGGNGTTVTDTVDTTTTLTTGTWTHIGLSLVQSGGNTLNAAVINGAKENEATQGYNVGSSASTLALAEGFEARFDGKMAGVGIWNSGLTADEWAALGKAVSPLAIRRSLLRSYSPLVREPIDFMGGATWTVTEAVPFPHPRVFMPAVSLVLPDPTVVSPPASTAGRDLMLLGVA